MGRMKMRPILRLITGAAGTGKTSRCIELFRDRILASGGSGLDSASYFILPNKEHTDRIHDVLTRDPRVGGLVQHHLLPIGDFVRFKCWTGRDRVVTQFERRWFARRVLDAGAWTWMAQSAGTAGMADCMANWIRAMKTAGADAAGFERAARGPLAAAGDPDKLRDLTAFYRDYENLVRAEGWQDPEDAVAAYARATAERPEAAPAEMDLVVLDGFFSLTHQQLVFLEAAARRSAETVVTLTLPEAAEEGVRAEAFLYPLRLRRKLLGMGFVEERIADAPRRFKSAGLAALERSLPAPAAETDASGVRRIEAAGRRQEVEAIGRAMAAQVRSGRCHWSDQMAVFRGVLAYRPYLEEVFGALEIPYELHERRRLSEHPSVRRMIEWLELTEPAEAAEGAPAVIRVHRWAMWMDAPEVQRELDALPSRLVWEQIPEAVSGSSTDWERERGRMKRFLELDDARGLKTFLEELFRDCAGEQALPETRRAADLTRELIERQAVRPIAGREGVRAAVERFRGDLKSGLYSFSDRRKNCVQIYDTALALPKEYRIVYVGGLNHGEFPAAHREDPILADAERRILAAEGYELDTAEDRRKGEAFFFYMAATRASEELVLSRFAADDEGRSTAESAWWRAAADVFGGTLSTERLESDALLPPAPQLRLPKDLIKKSGQALAPGSPDAAWAPALGAAWDRLDAVDRRLAGFGGTAEDFGGRCAQFRRPAAVNPELLGPAAFQRRKPWSATEAQSIRQCRFKYFAQYGIGIKPPVETTPVMREGEIWHKALEILMRQVFGGGKGGPRPVREAVFRAAPAALEQALREHPPVPERFYSRTARLERIRRRWPRVVEAEWDNLAATRSLAPAHFEAGFGLVENGVPSDRPAFAVTAGSERLEFQGKIDRIDADPASGRALAVDYKSGKGFAPAELKKGMRFQAVLYALALEKVWGYQPVGTEYVSLKSFKRGGLLREDYFLEERPKSRLKNLMDAATFDAFIAGELAALAGDWGAYKSGDIAADSKSCQNCDFYPMCRYEKRRDKK